MSYISTRIVKGTRYYYLEESFFFNKKLKKESVYLGPDAASNDELLLGFEILKTKCIGKGHTVLVPPLTEFISNRTANILEKKKNSKNNYKEKLLALQNLFGKNQKLPTSLRLYQKLLLQKASLTEENIFALCKSLTGKTKKDYSPESISLISLLTRWFFEKENLIHPAELATKLHAKFIETKILDAKENEIIAFLLMNFVLEKNNFSFVSVSTKRKKAFSFSLSEEKKENYKALTEFLAKELRK